MADKKTTMRRFNEEVIGGGNLELVDEFTTEDFVDHEVPPGSPGGREGVKSFVSMFRQGFPDLTAEVEQLLEDGDHGIVRATFSGTHDGDFMGVPASGKKVSFQTVDVVRFDGDRVAEHWGVTDVMSLMQQIGAIPEPAA